MSLCSLDLIKSVDAPATINSASLHPDKDFFVAGGEDFKLYKYDYSTKEELGKWFCCVAIFPGAIMFKSRQLFHVEHVTMYTQLFFLTISKPSKDFFFFTKCLLLANFCQLVALPTRPTVSHDSVCVL